MAIGKEEHFYTGVPFGCLTDKAKERAAAVYLGEVCGEHAEEISVDWAEECLEYEDGIRFARDGSVIYMIW